MEELILAIISGRVLAGNRWYIPIEEIFMKEPCAGMIKGIHRESVSMPELASIEGANSPRPEGQGQELPTESRKP